MPSVETHGGPESSVVIPPDQRRRGVIPKRVIDILNTEKVSFEPETIYHLGGQSPDIEILVRPENDTPAGYLEKHIRDKRTHEVALQAINDAKTKMKESGSRNIQINLYMWDLLHPSVQDALRHFPSKNRLIIEVVEDLSDRMHEGLFAESVIKQMLRFSRKGIGFAIDDYTFDASAQSENKNSQRIYELLSSGMKAAHLINRVKFDGPTMIRPIFTLKEEEREKHIRHLRTTIKSMKERGVSYFIAEFVQNEEEISILREIGFTSFQGKYLHIAHGDALIH